MIFSQQDALEFMAQHLQQAQQPYNMQEVSNKMNFKILNYL